MTIRKTLVTLILAASAPSTLLAQIRAVNDRSRFTHVGSFVVSVDDEGELNFSRGLLRFDGIARDRVQGVLRLDFRALIARNRIENKLRSSPQLIAAITHAIKLQIAAQRGIKDLSLITVPQAVIDEQVNAYVEDHITDDAVIETTIREVYLRLPLNGRISDIGENTKVAILEVGKLDPVHEIFTDFTTNPTQGLYYFAVSQPAIRFKAQSSAATTAYAQVSNDRYGAVEDPSGSDAISFTKELMSRSHGDLLKYNINSGEVGIIQSAPQGSLITAIGRRPQRDFLTHDEVRDNYYAVVTYKADLPAFNLQLQSSLDGIGESNSVKRANVILSRPLLDERAAIGTQFFIRNGGDQERLVSLLAGANLKLIRTRHFEAGVGAKYSRFKLGDDWDSRAEAGAGFGWSFR